jgi:hypothetical protein
LEPLDGDAGAPGYIYGKYKRYGSTDLDETFFPVTFTSPENAQTRTGWLAKYCTLP